MKLSAIRGTKNPWAIAGLIFVTHYFQLYILYKLPIFDLGLPGNWPVYVMRTISMAFSVLLVWWLAPDALRFFKFRFNQWKMYYLAAMIGAFVAAAFVNLVLYSIPVTEAFGALIFSMFIGFDEEFFDRVFVFGLLQRIGFEFALAASAVIFGAMHLTNFFYGDESFNYVLGHVVSAAGFGYLMAVTMVVSGNVWLPVLIHGLADLRWVSMDTTDYQKIVSGNTNWLSILIPVALTIFVSRVMLGLHQGRNLFPQSWNRPLRFLGLVE